MGLSPQQFGPFKREHAPKQAIAWQLSKGGAGGVQREQARGRLVGSKPYPRVMGKQGPSSVLELMEKLAPGSTTLHQRTRGLN